MNVMFGFCSKMKMLLCKAIFKGVFLLKLPPFCLNIQPDLSDYIVRQRRCNSSFCLYALFCLVLNSVCFNAGTILKLTILLVANWMQLRSYCMLVLVISCDLSVFGPMPIWKLASLAPFFEIFLNKWLLHAYLSITYGQHIDYHITGFLRK